MSCYPLFSAAAGGRPMAIARPLIFERLLAMLKLAGVTAASQLEARPTPEMISSGIREIDALTGGLPRGCLTEICGPASSGRTSILLATLAAATQREEACTLVDVSDAFDPISAAAAGVNFERLLWVRCSSQGENGSPRRRPDAEKKKGKENFDSSCIQERPVEQALRVVDMLLQSGGFGLVVIDLSDVPVKTARRISLTSWFRFQRTVERTPTVLLAVTRAPCAQTCGSLLLQVQASGRMLSACLAHGAEKITPTHAQLLSGLHVEGELLRSRRERKPMHSATAAFATRAARVG